ncbi:MAG: hypothetical protein Q9M94_01305 [Candidatus Gracilibacteria bacterium]|nr:hypothetical protein [Candidatus Gracilibacteria bacterium]MDQ7023261.1 hypothetical protein [Candidatus Gracilibacteria bacterium]
MVALTITNISQNIFDKKIYTAEELLSILINKLDYSIELGEFSEEENKELLNMGKGRYEKISNLID